MWRHQSEYFNTTTYLSYLEEVVVPGFYRRRHRIYLIQDNASYHKAPEVKEWLRENHRYLEMFSLPAYSPRVQRDRTYLAIHEKIGDPQCLF